MPKKEDIPPTTEDKIYETRKSLPLYKKIQYFVQANRGWVVKISILWVIATAIIVFILFFDRIVILTTPKKSVDRKLDYRSFASIRRYEDVLIDKSNGNTYTPLTDTPLWDKWFHEEIRTNMNGRLSYTKRALINDVPVQDGDLYKVSFKVNGFQKFIGFIDSKTQIKLPTYTNDVNSDMIDNFVMLNTDLSFLKFINQGDLTVIRYTTSMDDPRPQSAYLTELVLAAVNDQK